MPDIREALSIALAKAKTPMNTTTPVNTQVITNTLAQWDDEGNSLSTSSPAAPVHQTHSASAGEVSPRHKGDKGVSRTTFNFIRDNPNMHIKNVVAKLTLLGLNPSSTTSLCAQMHKQGLIHRDEFGRLRALVPEYVPIKSAPTSARNTAKKEFAARTKRHDAAHPAQATPAPARAALVLQKEGKEAPVTVAQVLQKLNVKEAYELYSELRKMFERAA